MSRYADPVYDETLWEDIPEEFRDYSLDQLVHNRVELEHFRQFLADNYASMDLTCWVDIETFRRLPHKDTKKRDQKAKEIKTKYFNKKYFFGPSSPAGKEGQEKVEGTFFLSQFFSWSCFSSFSHISYLSDMSSVLSSTYFLHLTHSTNSQYNFTSKMFIRWKYHSSRLVDCATSRMA